MNQLAFIQFVKFCMVGASNTIISYVVFSLCVYTGIHYMIANVIAFFVSVLNAYYWSNRYVFKKRKGETRCLRKTLLKTYIAYGSTGLLLGSILLILYVDLFHILEYVAQLLVLVITIPLNYIINKYWSFNNLNFYEED